MRIREVIFERIVNLTTSVEKQKCVDQVWDILQTSYAPIDGGFMTADTKEELINRFPLWKLVIRNGLITAVMIEKEQFGRKSIAVGSDGTAPGKQDVKMLMKNAITSKRTWAEVSGAPEAIYRNFGAIPIESKYAEILSKHSVVSYNEDGYHYTRLFNGHPKEKIIYGVAILQPSDVDLLQSKGISLHELPANIKLAKSKNNE